ncbi:MAG: hypothetical protein QOG53_1643 [Frankiales bacterium]|nr:hypothetical protein [Frankiales bacterium]
MTVVPTSRGAAVAVVAVVAGITALLTAAPQAARAHQSNGVTVMGTDGQFRVDVLVDTLLPRVVRPHSTVRVTGRLVSRSDTELTDVEVRLRVRTTAVGSRSELAATAMRTSSTGEALTATTTPVVAKLAPGGVAAFTVAVPADDLRLRAFGVYPFAVEVQAHGGPNSTVGRVQSFLPWVPTPGGFRATRVAWVWPLVDVPNRAATTTFPDDHLAETLSSGGRLGTLVSTAASLGPTAPAFNRPVPPRRPVKPSPTATPTTPVTPPAPAPEAQRPVPVTYAIDPSLAQAAADMSDGYNVRPRGDRRAKTASGAGRAAATSWLTLLRQTLRPQPAGVNALFALPYADADVSALARANMDPDITAAVTRGREVAASAVGVQPDSGMSWPIDGFITPRALDDLAGSGVRSVVLNEAAVPLTTPLSYTTDAGAKLDSAGGTLSALLVDTTLGQVMLAAERTALDEAATTTATTTPAPTQSTGPLPVVQPTYTTRLLEQRFLAETALITAERPVDSRDVVIAPPRRWDPDPALAADLLADTGRVPWLQPITLPDVHTSDAARTGLTYPDSAVAAELPGSYLTGRGGVAGLRRNLATFRSILQPPVGPTAVSLDYATLRTESTAWRDDKNSGVALRDEVATDLRTKQASVKISSSRRLITLASRNGTIPITIVNDLDQSVVVRLQVKATSDARLSAPDSAPQTVAAGHKVTYEVKAVVNQAGLFPVTVQLLTPDKKPYGPEVTLRLRSTAYGQLAVGITGGALGVLFLAILVRLIRRGRHARRHDLGDAAGET